jgi:creatinine amidohydrolase
MKKPIKHFFAYACLCNGLLFVASAVAQQDTDEDPRSIGGGSCAKSAYNCVGAPNPLPVVSTVWVEEMTWMDVRDAVAAGKKTIIIPAGGIEPNGPWLALGKHDYVLRATCDAIVRKLGNALCAPIIAFVPEGDLETKTGHMNSPGTIGVREETYEALVTDIARSMKAHGFENIILIGDHGGDQDGMKAVAEKLHEAWGSAPAVHYIPEYYKSWDGAVELLLKQGVGKAGISDGLHDDPSSTLLMMVTDPSTVRWEARIRAGKATIDGVSIADKQKALKLGKELVEYRATVTAEAITRAIAPKPKAH